MPNIKLQVRRDTASTWTSVNPVLLPGELGFETDTGKLKIGKVTPQAWNDLSYINGVVTHTHTFSDLNVTGTPSSSNFLRGDFAWTPLSIASVSGLQAALDGKATTPLAISSVTGLQTALNDKALASDLSAKADASHLHSVNDLTATGVKNNTTYLRGDNVWAVPSGSGGGTGSISGVLSQAVTNWTNGQEIVLSHGIESNGVRLFAAYQQKSSSITDVTWNFNNTSDSKWTNGRIEYTRLTTPVGQLSTTAVSKDESAIPSFGWSSISSMTVAATEGTIKDSLEMDCAGFVYEDISGFLDSANESYATNGYGYNEPARRATISNQQAKFGSTSIKFNGNTQYTCVMLNNPDFATVGTGDWTIEFWVYFLSHKTYSIFFDWRSRGGTSAANGTCGAANGQALAFYPNGTETTPAGGIPLNTWHHIRYDRYNGRQYLYFNGNLLTSTADTRNMIYKNIALGGMNAYGETLGNHALHGYMDEFLFTNVSKTQGASSFSVPTAPYSPGTNIISLLHFEGTNGNTGPYTLNDSAGSLCMNYYGGSILPTWFPNHDTNGAYHFNNDRSGSILTFSNPVRTSDFTFEAWVYCDRALIGNNDMWLLDFRYNSANLIFLLSGAQNGNNGRLSYWNGGNNYISASAVPINAWWHLAIVRRSGVVYGYVDGVQGGSVADTTNFNITGAFLGGRHDNNDTHVSGFMKQIRFSTVARYTGNFTPPTRTTELDVDANTLVYLNGNFNGNTNKIWCGDDANGSVFGALSIPASLPQDATAMNGRALYVNNLDSKITIPSSTDFDLSACDFTIEASVFVESWRSVGTQIIGKGMDSGGGNFSIHTYAGNIYFHVAGVNVIGVAHPTINDSIWHHIAVSLSGNTYRAFFDGTLLTSVTSTTKPSFGSGPVNIGGRSDGSYPWNGKIGFARIRKGHAIYTGNFIPPTVFPLTLAETNLSVRIALSFDGRITWKAFNGTTWITANINDIKNTGMSPAVANAITQGQWATLFSGGVTQVDLAAYMESNNAEFSPNISDISFNAVSNYWETIPMNQLTVKLMPGDTRFVQSTGGTISFGKIVVAISS